MVAVIHTSSSFRGTVNYNEQKVEESLATCIAAVNYPKNVEDLSFHQKLSRLENQAELNVKTKVNCVHISLNFDPSEKLSTEQLKEISEIYIQKIGFVNQPYLLYEHHDAGHPHVHIVTTSIKSDGKRIKLHNLGRIQSEKARKEIDQSFRLVKAEDHKQRQTFELKPVNAQKVQYERTETKRAIANVINSVLPSYKYSPLAELNAVLKQYNVVADRGQESSRMYRNKGLVYRILDEHGNKVGVPIKASDFYNNPGLKYLQTRFEESEKAKQSHKVRVKNAIDLALIRNPHHTIESFSQSLQKQGIHVEQELIMMV
jgi:hypothetical protein